MNLDPAGNISRRSFLRGASALGGALVLSPSILALGRTAADSGLAVSDLPMGSAPAPVSLPHFPDRLHAFVWRNWTLVPAARLARVVGAKEADIRRMGRAMGLGRPPRIGRDLMARSYLTVIRRNWHLLPYPQLLELLEWTPERLAFTLREDDFLFVKLGNLKPKCEPLRYQAPDAATLQREGEIAQIVREEFPKGVVEFEDPPFGFVSELSRPSTESPFKSQISKDGQSGGQSERQSDQKTSGTLKYCYSYFALYGDPLLEQEADSYPEGYLARLAQAGVNGVWMQAVLHNLALFPWKPELSAKRETRLKNLRALVARARKHGLRVFLYLNEPRAMPLKFFEGRSDRDKVKDKVEDKVAGSRPGSLAGRLKGVVEGDHATLCTSAPEVQAYLVESIASICRAVPDLGGFFTITASENLTSCWSHGGGGACPRCAKRAPAEVIAEVNGLFMEGIRKSGTAARLIAWDWGWDDAWAKDAIDRLPPEVALMSVSEWRLPIERGGVKTEIGEYCLSAIGPGPRAREHWGEARRRKLKTIAKIQAGNTWELSAVPYIPAVENAARHAENLCAAKVDGIMLGWTLGGYPSPNLEVVAETLACGSAEQAMRQVAERRFGPALAPAVVEAWRRFSAAFREFPFHIGVVYSGPQQLGPANLLYGAPTGYHASMVGFPYDDLDAWRAVYPADAFIRQLDKVADGFTAALAQLRNATVPALAKAARAQRQAFEAECRVAEAAAIHFRSAANQARFVLARRSLEGGKRPADAAAQIRTLETVLKDEIALARRLHQIQCADSRIGFEASNQYYYLPSDLAEKVLNCRNLLARWLPRVTGDRI